MGKLIKYLTPLNALSLIGGRILMSEQEREKKYWYISLGFLMLATIMGFRLYSMGFHLALFSFPERIILPVLLMGSIPMALTFNVILLILTGHGNSLKFWVRKPSAKCRNFVRRIRCENSILDRLKKMGFQVNQESNDSGATYLEFKKVKAAECLAFLDHGLFGVVTLSAETEGTQIETKLTFDDIVLFDTGEINDLQHLADYISLKCTEFKKIRKVSLNLCCGLVLAYMTVISGLFLNPTVLSQQIIITTLSNSAILTLTAALLRISKQPGLMGYRVGLVGLGLAIVPYLAGFATLSLQSRLK
jgi:hypothetical protein